MKKGAMFVLAWLVLVTPSGVLAFGTFGHVTICEIAYREMTPAARTELNRLLEVHDEYTSFNRACLEADRSPRTRPSAHFVNYPRDLQIVDDDSCHSSGECVIAAIASDFAKLKDTSTPDVDRGEAMILLGHWVGDIHQPLHVSYEDDRGGNLIRKRGTCSDSNLHAVWDNCIVERRVLLGNAIVRFFGWAKFKRAYRAADRLLTAITDIQRTEWLDSEVKDWAAESYKITTTQEVGYCHRRHNACWYDTNNQFLDENEEQRTIQMDNDYLDQFAPIVEARLSQAGVRLGSMLNEALDP